MPIPALIAGAAALGSAFIGSKSQSDTNAMSMEIAKYQNAWNEQMYERQKEDNIEFWNMQNQYNSPAETMKRMTEAGLNPRGTGLGQYANAGPISSPHAPTAVGAQVSSPLAAYSEMLSTLGGLYQMAANIKKTEAETSAIKERNYLDFLRGWSLSFNTQANMDKHALYRYIHGISGDNLDSSNFGDRLYRFSGEGLSDIDLDIKKGIAREYRLKNSVLEENTNLGIGNSDGDAFSMLLRALLRQIYRGVDPDRTMFNR